MSSSPAGNVGGGNGTDIDTSGDRYPSQELETPISTPSLNPTLTFTPDLATGADGGATTAATTTITLYLCQQCTRPVSVSPPSPSADLHCPNCNGGSFAELQIPSPFPIFNPNHNPYSFNLADAAAGGPSAASLPLFFRGPEGAPIDDYSALFINRTGDAAANPNIVSFQNYVDSLRAGGVNANFVVENSATGEPTRAIASASLRAEITNFTAGDYFIGPGMEELIQQLTDDVLGPVGGPPASRAAVEGLVDLTVTEELLASDNLHCAVCRDTFELGKTVKQLPCNHFFHADCILPWLERHNSCPVCRFRLPTDDPNYEQRKARHGGGAQPNRTWPLGPGGSTDSSSGSGGGGDNRQRVVERSLFGIAETFPGIGGGGGDNMQPMVERRVFRFPSGSADSSSGGGSGGDNMQPIGERRVFRVPMPWFQQVSSLSETSNVGNNNYNSGNNGEQWNSESRGNQNFESET